MTHLDILYQDDHYVVVNKPAGLLVHRTRIDARETRFCLQIVRDLIGQRVYPVHRLDKPTSGALIFGCTPEAAGAMIDAFAGRKVKKTYLAVVRGYTEERGVIDYPLRAEADTILVGLEPRPPQQAVTTYVRLATVELPHAVTRYPTSRYSLVAVSPETGRRHQIRRHMRHIFHPIIGDGKHGEGRHNRFFRDRLGCDRMLLHAYRLSFRHPVTEESVDVAAPLDDVFASLLGKLGWSGAVRAE